MYEAGLTTSMLLSHAGANHGDTEIVSVDGGVRAKGPIGDRSVRGTGRLQVLSKASDLDEGTGLGP